VFNSDVIFFFNWMKLLGKEIEESIKKIIRK
jgi:hypothetical protein